MPTVLHTYVGATADDGRVTKAIDESVAGLQSMDTKRREDWVLDTYDSQDWIERRYTGRQGEEVLVFVARSYNLKRLYHHPELGVLHSRDLGRPTVVKFTGRSPMSVHVLRANAERGVAVYALLYDDNFVTAPIAFQLRISLENMVTPRKQTTLFLAYDPKLPTTAPLEGSLLVQVLSEVIRSFRNQPTDVASQSAAR